MSASRAARPPSTSTAEPNTDDARARLLNAGLQLFANQGYSQTSTRELAEAASVNVAAISYYFGDKAGLYRAVFFEPLGSSMEALVRFTSPGMSLEQALQAYFEAFLSPLREGDAARLCVKLRFREMLEPTGLWEEEVTRDIKPMHDAMLDLLARHMRLPAPDLELHRLVLSLQGLGVHVIVGHDITQQLAAELNDAPAAVDDWVRSLSGYALAMVQAEAARRGLPLTGDPL
jgi:TetR/AcrR family transcriptional regulator, regulator of cefoperazone and chloramphenicol sensitivity